MGDLTEFEDLFTKSNTSYGGLVMLKQEDMQAARKEARELELQLSAALQEYLKFDYATHFAHHGTDIESGEGGKVQQLENTVSSLLDKMQSQIDRMEGMGSSSAQSIQWKAQVARLRTVLQSSQSDFKRTRNEVKRKQESAALLRDARERVTRSQEDETAEMLYQKESEGINHSLRMVDHEIDRAIQMKDRIHHQQNRIQQATAQLMTMGQSIPGINALIAAATSKKFRDNMIVAGVVAVLICLTLWWMLH